MTGCDSFIIQILFSLMKTIVETSKAPAPIGPYSQAVICDGMLYSSGQIAIDPNTGTLVTHQIQAETKQVMENLKAVLAEANMDFDHVIKSTIFIMNMDDFQEINKIYGSYFNENTAPARETVQVARLPKDVNLEISVIAKK